jgi:hypothetical protein
MQKLSPSIAADSKLLGEAFARLWAYKLEARAAGRDFRGDTYYTTAQELQEAVKGLVFDRLHPDPKRLKEFGPTLRGAYGVRCRGDLQKVVRNYLLQGPFDRENFGRGHVSGMRFRPRGEPLSAAEATTKARKAVPRRPAPVHATLPGSLALLCMPPRQALYRGPNYRIRRTSDRAAVTCPRCLKLLQQAPEGRRNAS